MLQAGSSRVKFPMYSLGFFIDLILPGRPMALGSTQPLTKMSTRSVYWGDKRGQCAELTTLPHTCTCAILYKF